jgi:hypothetical protein
VCFCAVGVVLLCCAFRAVVTFTRKATGSIRMTLAQLATRDDKDAYLSAADDT